METALNIQEQELIDTSKATALIEHLNNMTSNEIGYAFENMNYHGVLQINCIISHALIGIMEHAKNQIDKAKN